MRLSAATPQRVACIRLAELYELQGKWNKARKVLDRLLERLQALGSSQPLDIVEALLARAEVQAAQSRFDSATASLQDVVPFLSELTRPQRGRALARMSEFYLATHNGTVGTRLLTQAQAELEAEQDLDGAEYVTAATDVAAVLRWYGRGSESMKILEPIVAYTRSRFARTLDLPADLRDANLRAAGQYLLGLKEQGTEQAAQQLNEEIKEWRQEISRGSGAPTFAVKNGEVLAPRLVRRRQPSYTRGASKARVRGTVVLAIEVWPDGLAHNVRIIRRLPLGLSWAAIRAVREWRFRPGTKSGEPVKVAATIEINFRPKRGERSWAY